MCSCIISQFFQNVNQGNHLNQAKFNQVLTSKSDVFLPFYCNSYDEKLKPDLPSLVAFSSSFWNGLQVVSSNYHQSVQFIWMLPRRGEGVSNRNAITVRAYAYISWKRESAAFIFWRRRNQNSVTNRMEEIPAIRIIIEAIDGAITTRETNVVKTSYSQPTVCPNIHKVLLFPSLH